MSDQKPKEKGTDFYSRVGMCGRVGYGAKPAVLVIDEQKGMTDAECPLGSTLDDMIVNSAALIRAAHAKSIPVIYTVVAYKPDMSDAGVFGLKIPTLKLITVGSKWAELDDRLPYEADKDYLLVKKLPSGFFGTHLIPILRYHQVDTIILIGISTSGCVRASAYDGLSYGYRMIVPRDCCGDRCKAAHEANLFDIDGKLGDVTSMKEVLAYFDTL